MTFTVSMKFQAWDTVADIARTNPWASLMLCETGSKIIPRQTLSLSPSQCTESYGRDQSVLTRRPLRTMGWAIRLWQRAMHVHEKVYPPEMHFEVRFV